MHEAGRRFPELGRHAITVLALLRVRLRIGCGVTERRTNAVDPQPRICIY
jgi:hypothetical protein